MAAPFWRREAMWRPFGEPRKPDHTGATYKVDLAPAEDEYLLWDEPLSKQSPKVEKAALTRRRWAGCG